MRFLLKAIKREMGDYDSVWQFLYLHDWFDPVHNVINWFRNTYARICRFFFWGWKLRNSHDWDGHTLYEIIHLKLERMDKEMLNKGHLAWQYEEKKRCYRTLKIAKEAARRLSKGRLEDRAVTKFHDTYGYTFKGQEKRDNCLSHIFGMDQEPKILLSEGLYKKLQKSAWKEDADRLQYHKDLLFNTLNKWLEHYWD